jgi:hypothetical protein
MDVKLIEVRDRNTMIPAMAIRVTSTDDAAADWLLRRAGYSLDGRTVILMRLTDCEGHCDVYDWRDARTVHDWLERDDHFDSLQHGSVVDVEYILGETVAPKVSERLDPYPPASERIHAEGSIKEPWASSARE